MDLTGIAEVVDNYGLKGGFFIILLFILVTLIKSNWFSKLITKLSNKIIDKFINKKKDSTIELSESDIINHDIFNYIDFWIYSKVPTLTFSSEYRTKIFRGYLNFFLRSYKKHLVKYIIDKDYQTMDGAELTKSLLSLINIIIYDYERNSLNSDIPPIVIERMKIINNDTVELSRDLIESIGGSQFYSSNNNLLKVYSILNILLSILEKSLSSAEAVCNSINGELDE